MLVAGLAVARHAEVSLAGLQPGARQAAVLWEPRTVPEKLSMAEFVDIESSNESDYRAFGWIMPWHRGGLVVAACGAALTIGMFLTSYPRRSSQQPATRFPAVDGRVAV